MSNQLFKEKIIKNIEENLLKINSLNSSNDLQANYNLALTAVSRNAAALQYALEEFKNNKNIVLAAVKQYGGILKYASDELKNDREIVLIAVSNSSQALSFASNQLKNNKDIVLLSVKYQGISLRYASSELRNDKNIVLAAIKQDINALAFASEELQNNSKFLRILKNKKYDIVRSKKNWFDLKMEVLVKLEIKEQEQWMNNNIPLQEKSKIKLRKI